MAATAAARGGTSSMSNSPAAAHAHEAEGMQKVRRKKDFRLMERVDGRMVNVLQGLELHTGVFSAAEQQRIVDYVHELQDKGRRGLLGSERTYSEPRRWMRGKGRATIQFGCCYNYAADRDGNPPGILRGEAADPLPPPLKAMVRRLVAWRVLPPDRAPDSCIVNVYDVGDCIPPHVDHRDFARPFCTVSFLAEQARPRGRGTRCLAHGPMSRGALGPSMQNSRSDHHSRARLFVSPAPPYRSSHARQDAARSSFTRGLAVAGVRLGESWRPTGQWRQASGGGAPGLNPALPASGRQPGLIRQRQPAGSDVAKET